MHDKNAAINFVSVNSSFVIPLSRSSYVVVLTRNDPERNKIIYVGNIARVLCTGIIVTPSSYLSYRNTRKPIFKEYSVSGIYLLITFTN